jgi:hypothetical protein
LGVTDITDEEIEIYQELQHQNYKPLADRQKEVLVLLSKMFEANKKTKMFRVDFFQNRLSDLWFHYCNSMGRSESWRVYRGAIFVRDSDLHFSQKVKFRLKAYLK